MAKLTSNLQKQNRSRANTTHQQLSNTFGLGVRKAGSNNKHTSGYTLPRTRPLVKTLARERKQQRTKQFGETMNQGNQRQLNAGRDRRNIERRLKANTERKRAPSSYVRRRSRAPPSHHRRRAAVRQQEGEAWVARPRNYPPLAKKEPIRCLKIVEKHR
ncbi:predicted protein [Arabidopsis lyrata subsp. lyrata]|uniref:Predicted protein n=1 Tax=Arabidopsis lyrata subsp. lyrata TaxID=81972 RepID=D7MS15_ARALL|nr:predicted protein [Arabidopsis lyrata subsp. lyrata]